MLDDGERQAYSADHVAELVHRLFEKRIAFHREDGEIAPGVTVHRMSGHTMGMQSVRVPTRRGWVLLASDASHYYEHWVRRIPFAICCRGTISSRATESSSRSPTAEDHVVPGHDPLVRSLYPAAGGSLGGDVVRLDEAPSRTLREVFPEHVSRRLAQAGKLHHRLGGRIPDALRHARIPSAEPRAS